MGAGGTPHLQGVVYFSCLKSLAIASALLPRAHLEPMRGTIDEAADYCKKDGDYWEHGEKPFSQAEKGAAEKQRFDLALAAAREGRMVDIPADILVRYGSGLERAARMVAQAERLLTDTELFNSWYYGPTGTGKSRKAREENPGCYLKMCNKWWDGYQNQEVVLIEDFDKVHQVLCHHMKIWGDRYAFKAEVKGGTMDIRPRKIIVTSNYSPSEIWSENSDLEPILRRFRVTRFDSVTNLGR